MTEVFVDTSALYALLVAEDAAHPAAREAFERLDERATALVTSSFVVQETVALLQTRIGIAAVRTFRESILPALDVVWIDETLCHQALSALLAASNRRVSLTYWSSFEIMRARQIRKAFAIDAHFTQQGFESLADGHK